MTKPIVTSIALALSITACGSDFDPPSHLERTRVLGARAEVDGAPDRASPRIGESFTVRWKVAGPEAVTPSMSLSLSVCPTTRMSSESCAGPALATFEGQGAPVLSYTVPALDASIGALLFTGVMHRSDAPPASGDAVVFQVALAGPMGGNGNPRAIDEITFDGAPWPEGEPCGARAKVGSPSHTIGLPTRDDDRERFTALAGDPPRPTPTRERLQISSFATHGELGASYAFVEADAANGDARVKWDVPPRADVPAEGITARFVFVVRDDRGGATWMDRTLCIDP